LAFSKSLAAFFGMVVTVCCMIRGLANKVEQSTPNKNKQQQWFFRTRQKPITQNSKSQKQTKTE
jgi:hypothetical protein